MIKENYYGDGSKTSSYKIIYNPETKEAKEEIHFWTNGIKKCETAYDDITGVRTKRNDYDREGKLIVETTYNSNGTTKKEIAHNNDGSKNIIEYHEDGTLNKEIKCLPNGQVIERIAQ